MNASVGRSFLYLGAGVSKFSTVLKLAARLRKHLGAPHTDNADQWAETAKRVQAGFFAVKRVARYWSLDTARSKKKRGGLSTSRKLRAMQCVLDGALLACSNTAEANPMILH